ncbi:MAG: UDP-glucose 4-epimerase [Blastocatellia bacterium]|jgi:UDP-glucose 4-epimerase|nr:UDP-glucose 4-epimerase [Blastocatellia bacterium]
MNDGPTLVVLGGCGFIGSHLCRAMVGEGRRVRVFDKLYAERNLIRDLAGEIEVVEGDAARTADVMAALEGAETVLHLVHTTVPGSSMADPSYDVESNVAASVRWLSRLGETSVRKIVFVSSGGTVYGIPQRNPIDEQHPTDPISSYGITKLALEKYVAMYAAAAGIDYLILRPSNVYGEGQRLQIGQGVIGVLVDRALRGQELDVWGTGENLRDYIYISDFVGAVRSLLTYTGSQRIFNVSGGKGHSVKDILKILQNQLDRLPEIRYEPARGFDVPDNVLDASLLHAEVGWEPRISLEEGVARVVQWLRKEQPG